MLRHPPGSKLLDEDTPVSFSFESGEGSPFWCLVVNSEKTWLKSGEQCSNSSVIP